MGRYIQFSDVTGRYANATEINSVDHVGSNWISYAETYLDGSLSTHFTVPFSSDNLTIRDMAADLTYAKIGLLSFEDADKLISSVNTRIARLKRGEEAMVNNSGTIIGYPSQGPYGSPCSTTSGYTPIFGVDDSLDWAVNTSYLEAWQSNNR